MKPTRRGLTIAWELSGSPPPPPPFFWASVNLTVGCSKRRNFTRHSFLREFQNLPALVIRNLLVFPGL